MGAGDPGGIGFRAFRVWSVDLWVEFVWDVQGGSGLGLAYMLCGDRQFQRLSLRAWGVELCKLHRALKAELWSVFMFRFIVVWDVDSWLGLGDRI